MVMIVHVVSTEIHALHVSIVIRVLLVMVMIVHVASTEILVLLVIVMIVHAALTEILVHRVMVATGLVVSIATLVLLVMVMIVHVASTEIHVPLVTVMIARAVLIAMIVLVVSIVMIVHAALIATTAHRAQQRKNVQTKYVVALANAVHPEKCQQHQSVHVKSGLTKGQCVRSVIQTWVAFAPKAQAVRKKADEKKCVHSTPLWNSLSVH
jgi:hypothetical protein